MTVPMVPKTTHHMSPKSAELVARLSVLFFYPVLTRNKCGLISLCGLIVSRDALEGMTPLPPPFPSTFQAYVHGLQAFRATNYPCLLTLVELSDFSSPFPVACFLGEL